MEGPYLPEGSGDEESPEELRDIEERALAQYEERLYAFERSLDQMRPTRWVRRRRMVGDYKTKNCEEALGERR